ncbi:MAG: GGDEF domain-containing protein [Roseburia sp.]
MEDFKEQYRQELVYQEIKSNKHTLEGFMWFLAVIGVIWLLTMTGFFKVDKRLLTMAFVSAFILFLLPLYLYFKSDLSKAWYKYFFLALICVVSGVITSFLSFHAVLLYVAPLLFAIQYRKRSTIWFVYVVNLVTMTISSFISFYYGICDLNLFLESQHVRKWYMDIVAGGTLSLPVNDNLAFIILVFEILPRSMILLAFSIVMQYTVVSSNEDAFRIARLTYLKETDIKTGVFNKNKYEEMVTEYYPKIEQIAVVFWDLNNLKCINDKYGHAMGDKGIERFSFILHSYSSDRCRVYRIGGDEFLMIMDNPDSGEVEAIVKSVRETLEENKIGNTIKLSSAVGFAFGKGKDVTEVVKKADVHMYEDKRLGKERVCAF